jgi:hypothetical protein
MDPKDRNESKLRWREETLAQSVGKAFDEIDARNAGDCPDGEILAAYAEQALSHAETGKWESHFATCSRCRKILLVMAASADADAGEMEVASVGNASSTPLHSADDKTEGARQPRQSWWDWRMRWFAPALGAAVVLVVWLAMRPPWRVSDQSPSGTLIAQAPKEEAQQSPASLEADRPSRVGPSQDQKTKPAPPSIEPSDKAAPFSSANGAPENGRVAAGADLDKISPSAGASVATNSVQAEKKQKSFDESELQPVPPPPPSPSARAAMPAPAAPQSDAKSASNSAAAGALQAGTNSNVAGNAPARDQQAATAQGDAGAGLNGEVREQVPRVLRSEQQAPRAFAALRSLQTQSALLKAPSGTILWRAGKGGSIERSNDTGKTWVLQASPSQEDWLAGAAISDTIAWVAGRHGAIARTVDGARWERVSPPAQAAVNATLPDWTAITARDAQNATITASGGRKFITADGGMTWQAQ